MLDSGSGDLGSNPSRAIDSNKFDTLGHENLFEDPSRAIQN